MKCLVCVMPFNFLKKKSNVDYKARLENKLCIARVTPEPIFDLSECNLSVIPPEVFAVCRVLRKEALFLQENALPCLPSGKALADLDLLKCLDLHSNQITSLPEEISSLVNLEVLDVSHNHLHHLPQSIGKLVKLETLNAENNKLKDIPATLGHCKRLKTLNLRGNVGIRKLPVELGRLHLLQDLLVDGSVQYPGPEVVDQGAQVTVAFLASEMGQVSDEDVQEMLKGNTLNDSQIATDYFLMQEKFSLLQEQKDAQRADRLLWEKSLLEERQKEFEMQDELRTKRMKLVDDIKTMQDDIESQIFKVQLQKDNERNVLIRECLEVEEKLNSKVQIVLDNARKFQQEIAELTEKERAMEEQLLYEVNVTSKSIDESKILDAMNDLVKEELIKAERLRGYAQLRDATTRTWISQEAEMSGKLSELVEKSKCDSENLTAALMEDEQLQKAAVASLMEQSDAKSYRLAQQIAAVESQLAELTHVELEKKRTEHDGHVVELALSRTALAELLVDLFAQQQARRDQLVAALIRMESGRDQAGENYWMEQYQRLLESSSYQMVKQLQTVDVSLHEALFAYGVAHYVPLLIDLLTSKDAAGGVTDEKLLQVGVKDPDSRLLILKAIKSCLESDKPAPSAPEEMEFEPSAPSSSFDECSVIISADECVVCLERNVEAIFVPCGHLCCCALCGNLASCPLCRVEIERILYIKSS